MQGLHCSEFVVASYTHYSTAHDSIALLCGGVGSMATCLWIGATARLMNLAGLGLFARFPRLTVLACIPIGFNQSTACHLTPPPVAEYNAG